MTEQTEFRKWYYFFGQELRHKGNQLVGNCPFCYKEDHFFVYNGLTTSKKSPGMFTCKKCGKGGNHFTFLREFYGHSKSSFIPTELTTLATNRRLLTSTLTFCGITINPVSGYPLIPHHNTKATIVNLYQVFPDRENKTKVKIFSSPSPCEAQLWGIESVIKTGITKVYICEGHWDRLALIETFAHLKLLKPLTSTNSRIKLKGTPDYNNPLIQQQGIVAIPGANTFKEHWVKHFKNKDVVLLYDNDKPGQDGMKRATRLLSPVVSSLQRIQWKENDPEDIRDLLNA